MKTITIPVEFAGMKETIDINIPDLLNAMRKTNKAIFIETVLEIFASIDFSDIKLEDFQQAIIRPNALAVNKVFGFKTPELCIDFLDWCINSEIDYSLPEFSAKTIFEKFINSRV